MFIEELCNSYPQIVVNKNKLGGKRRKVKLAKGQKSKDKIVY
jgi:hypothetical protein